MIHHMCQTWSQQPGDYVRARVLVPRNPGVTIYEYYTLQRLRMFTHKSCYPFSTGLIGPHTPLPRKRGRVPLRGLYKVPLALENPLQFLGSSSAGIPCRTAIAALLSYEFLKLMELCKSFVVVPCLASLIEVYGV